MSTARSLKSYYINKKSCQTGNRSGLKIKKTIIERLSKTHREEIGTEYYYPMALPGPFSSSLQCSQGHAARLQWWGISGNTACHWGEVW
jgi:hypothetical protein